MSIPLLDLQAQLRCYRDEALKAIERVVDSQAFIMGPEVAAFEGELAAWCELPHAIGVSSGTDALLVALMALNVGPGDEVVTTPFSFFATVGVISRLGARPVFADIDPETFNLTEAGVRAAITPRTKAIIPVHLFGQVCELGSLYAEKERPAILEDAAQALGARKDGQHIGHFGEMAAVSFFPSKNLGGFGDGGAVLCRDAELAERLRVLRVHGSKPKYYHHVVGGNFRLDAIQAAVLRVKLPHLAGWTEGRQRNARIYDELFLGSGLPERGLVRTPVVQAGHDHVFNQYVVRAENRDGLQKHLSERGIGTMVYYPGALHLQPCFRDLGHGPGDFPLAEQACREVLALPVYPELTTDQMQSVVMAIADFYGV